MKLLFVFIGLLAYVTCETATDHCFKQVTGECAPVDGVRPEDLSCNAQYGVFKNPSHVTDDLKKYAHSHILHSFNYLLRAAHFGNYQTNREGFEKLFHKLSDSTWDDGIDLIKYLGKRGAEMNFNVFKETAATDKTIEVHELKSLAYALDAQKALAEEAFKIHKLTSHKDNVRDPEVASYLENHFVHKQADSIRDLSGHVNDLKRLMKDDATNKLSLFLFDEYLQKV